MKQSSMLPLDLRSSWVNDSTAKERAVVSGNMGREGNPQQKEYKEKRDINSGCSRHMTRNMCYLTDFEAFDGVFVSFGDGKGRISGKGKIKTRELDFDDVYFCIKREYNVARTPQQNRVAEKRNKTLIEAARTMLVDSKLPTTFWAEAVNTACYVLNRALVTKPHKKTPYELIHVRPLLIDFIKLFGCPVTIINTRDNLGKFEGKADEGYFVGYAVVSKAMRVFNKRTGIVEETLNIRFQGNVHNVKENRPDWLFDIDSLTISMNYVPVVIGNQTNGIAGTKEKLVAGQDENNKELEQEYILIPICITGSFLSQDTKDNAYDAGKKASEVDADNTGIFGNAYDDDVLEEEVDMNNVASSYAIPEATKHKDDILLVQVYVDDIIFGSTKKELSTEFKKLMHDKFQMSFVGELSFFLGLQVKQKSDGIFISQDKYMAEILKKFDFVTVKSASTPMESNKPLIKDEEAEDIDVHLYRSMIGSLMYLTTSRPDITFTMCACARFQITLKTSHLHAVKIIFRCLKGQPKLGLWYPKDSPFDLEAYSDSDYAGASLDRKSTT
uniref:Uncharacterized mitochondrial protein AtMg00810-like n=1 Tax=Tanacetum cinerariifolium TaxID=118510 RepID=A0A6L2J4S0_TANCI|nr:uncharacterized mitochondrial protein AtMg00810-like [Tanacetum cinerariifolium]